jgi:hypothetical protein
MMPYIFMSANSFSLGWARPTIRGPRHQLGQLPRHRFGRKAEKIDPDQILHFAREIPATAYIWIREYFNINYLPIGIQCSRGSEL